MPGHPGEGVAHVGRGTQGKLSGGESWPCRKGWVSLEAKREFEAVGGVARPDVGNGPCVMGSCVMGSCMMVRRWRLLKGFPKWR